MEHSLERQSQDQMEATVYERDHSLVSTIQNGELARLSLENDWDNMLPMERIEAAEAKVQADQAKNELYSIYADTPENVVNRMINKHRLPSDVSVEDMVSAANIGLFEAMLTWDYGSEKAKLAGFRTYASSVIKEKVLDEFRNSEIFVTGPKTKHIGTIASFAAESNLGNTTEEIADSIPEETISVQTTDMKGYSKKQNPKDYVEFMLRFAQPDVPVGLANDIEKAISNSRGLNGDQQLFDERGDETGNIIISDELYKLVRDQFERLPERERLIIRDRFGINVDGHTADPMTYQKTGNEFGVTRERIRQIESKALERLRHPNRSKLLPKSDAQIDNEFAQVDRRSYYNSQR